MNKGEEEMAALSPIFHRHSPFLCLHFETRLACSGLPGLRLCLHFEKVGTGIVAGLGECYLSQ